MSKGAKYLNDNYLDYTQIAAVVLVLISAFLSVPWLQDIMERNAPNKMIDSTEYLKDAKKLTVINEGHTNIVVEYSQYNDDNEYLATNDNIQPEFSKNADGTEVTMKFAKKYHRAYAAYGATILMHGPTLDSIEVSGPIEMQYSGGDSLSVVNKGAHFSIRAGDRYENVTLVSTGGSKSRLDYADIKNLKVDLSKGVITAGQVDNLVVNMPMGCETKAVNSARTVLTVEGVSAGSMVYNGTEQPAQPLVNDCGSLVVGK